MSDLILRRLAQHIEGTFGVIALPTRLLYTLENPWLDNRPNVSCIPLGKYTVTRAHTPKHGRAWLIRDVPDRTAILIHSGNTTRDTEGCPLLGRGYNLRPGYWALTDSRPAIDDLNAWAGERESFTLEIVHYNPYKL